MQVHHTFQPYDVSASDPVDVESMWTPASDSLVVANQAPLGRSQPTNVHALERVASSLVGGMLVARGVAEHGAVNRLLALVGSALVYRGISGHCHMYQALGIDTAHRRD